MLEYNPEHLRYLPQQAPFDKHLDAPGSVYAEHQKDLVAQQQARELMAMKQQAQAEDIRHSQVGDQQHAIGMQREEGHANRRDTVAEQEAARRENQVAFDRQRLEHSDIEKWANLMAYGKTPEEQQYAASMLQALHGKKTRQLFEKPTPVAPVAPPVEVKDPTLGGTIEAVDGQPMGHVKPPTAADNKLSGELDGIDQTYSKKLGVAPGRYIPGARLPVAKSTAMLSQDDPYNKL